ncbi:MAG: hypothetical protein P4L82_11275 [Ancalomicrobiaceae bacterium]|nr:hypothetical protein [Ancalomicrobiaceae bacterium]
MAANDGERGGTGGRRKPDPITIDLSATSVRVEPDAAAAEAKASAPEATGPKPAAAAEARVETATEPAAVESPEPATMAEAVPAPATEPAAEPAAEPTGDPAADRDAEAEAMPSEVAEAAAAVADDPAKSEPELPSGSQPASAASAPEGDGAPVQPELEPRTGPKSEPASAWSRTLVAALLGGVVGVGGVHLLSAVGLTPGASEIAGLNHKIAALAADPVHSLAAVTKELDAEKARTAALAIEIEKLRQLPPVPGASVGEIARILEPFTGRVAAAIAHMDDIEKRIAAEQAVVRGETKATGESVTERIAKLEASVSQRLAAVEATNTDSADKAAKSVAGVDKLSADFAELDKRASGDIAVARGELKELGTATTARFTALDGTLKTTGDAIKTNAVDLAKLTDALDGVAGKLADLDKRVSAELAVVRGTTSDFASQTQKQASETGDTLAKLQAQVATLDEMRHAIDGLGARIGAFDAVKKLVDANTARLGQVDEAKKAADGVASSLWLIDQRMAKLQAQLAEVDTLKASLASGEQKVDTLDGRLAPMEARLSQFDDWAKQGIATRKEAVAAIAIASLKSAVDSGRPFASDLAAAKSIAAGLVDLSGLEPYAAKGLATEADLVAAYPKMARATLDAADLSVTSEGGVLGTLFAHATQSVKIRREGEVSGAGADARLARIEARLGAHDLIGALAEWQGLPDAARAASADWGGALKARVEGAKVMASVTDEVLAKLNAATK